MTMPMPPSDPLGVALHQTEAELAEKLHEACIQEPDELSDEPTGEIAKLSDSLLAAARAAKDVVSLRKRRRERKRPVDVASEVESLREFVDTEGREWRVWPVIPGPARAGKREKSLGEFAQGWLAFETLDETLRRRLPHYPADWLTMPEERLQELLRMAVEAPTRRVDRRSPDERREPPS